MVDAVIMPDSISVGFRGGPVFPVSIAQTIGGQERRLANRSIAIHEYEWRGVDDLSAIVSLRDFWMDRRGALKGFLFKDWFDFSATNQTIGAGDGAETAFQVIKTYGSTNPYTRTIRHLGSYTVYLDAVEQVEGSDYSVSSTGLITFAAAPSSAVTVSATFEFYVPVRFGEDAFVGVMDQPYNSEMVLSVENMRLVEIVP